MIFPLTSSIRARVFASLAIAGWAVAANDAGAPSGKWEMQYLHESNTTDLTFTALRFSSATRGVAAGYVVKRISLPILGTSEKTQPFLLVTADAGKTWSPAPAHAVADDLAFAGESIGWMVSHDGIWKTEEAGRSWKRVSDLKGMRSIYFLTPEHGFAVGDRERVMETDDGGAVWKPVAVDPAAANQARERKRGPQPGMTAYTLVRFSDPNTGVILGTADNAGSGGQDDQSWANPDGYRSNGNNRCTLLFTLDGGRTWKAVVSRIKAELTRVSLRSGNSGLELLESRELDPWPSDVLDFSLTKESISRTFRQRNRAITDVLLTSGGDGWLAGFEPVGRVRSPIAGKVKILRSHDLIVWQETAVDYRALAHYVLLASGGGENVWAATDTGMILHYRAP